MGRNRVARKNKNPDSLTRLRILKGLPFPYPSLAEWDDGRKLGFRTNGPTAPWFLRGSALWLGWTYHGGEHDYSWPPYPYPLHDWYFWQADGGVGAFRWTNSQLRHYQARLIHACHPDISLSAAHRYTMPVYWAVSSRFGWNRWVS